MGSVDKQGRRCRTIWNQVFLISAALLITTISGCGSGVSSNQQTTTPPPPTQTSPQRYLAPLVAGSTYSNSLSLLTNAQTYTIDDVAETFWQTSYLLNSSQEGAQILDAGSVNAGSRGLLSLELKVSYNNANNFSPIPYNPPQTGFALELAGQAGGLVQLLGQPMTPLVPTANCPNISKAETYNFITIPTYLQNSASQPSGWSPTTQTAYGSVDIITSGSTVNFNNIQQFTFPPLGSVNGGARTNLNVTSVAATCGQTAYGNTISIPGQITVTDPGTGGGPPQAIADIGPTGLLVEDNGLNPVGDYQNALGAGTGAVGLPMPSSAVDTSALVGAQYLGFAYGSGVYTNASPSGGWSSHLVSFGGFSNVPSSQSCPSVPASTSTPIIYGGDYDPSTSPNGFGNPDLTLYLNAPTSNGLYPNATVCMGGSYPANTTKQTYSFPAVAIAGQLQGKSVIFLLGKDSISTQAWAIYLFQSN